MATHQKKQRNSTSPTRDNSKSLKSKVPLSPFDDHRSQTKAHAQLQELADDSAQVSQLHAMQNKHTYSHANQSTVADASSSQVIQLYKYSHDGDYWHLYASDHRPAHADQLDDPKGKPHKNSPKLFLEGKKAGQCYAKGGNGKLLFTVSATDLAAHRAEWLAFYCSAAEVTAGSPAGGWQT